MKLLYVSDNEAAPRKNARVSDLLNLFPKL